MVFYFTGTGNSKYIAEALADRLSDELVSINDIVKYNQGKAFESEKPFVIVSPIYAWRYPCVVDDFISTADFRGSKDIYFVATMGENTGNCDRYAEKMAAAKGMRFRGFRGVVMPNNYVIESVMAPEEVTDAIVAKGLIEAYEIAAMIETGQVLHKTDKTKLASILSGPVHNMFSKYMHSSEKYEVNDDCVSCGKCARLCVMNNITMNPGEKPTFGKACINCYACLQYCPKQAINIAGKTENHGRYTCKEYKKRDL